MKNFKDYLKSFKGNKVLMTIYPHPDDETMAAGGLLLCAKKLGFKTVVVCLTVGEAGECHVKKNGRRLADIRTDELNRAVEILGVDNLELEDFGDGKLRGTERKWVPWVKKMITKHQPGIVVTYDHSGLYGHPDHIALSLAVKAPIVFWSTLSRGYANRLNFTKDVREFMTSPTHFLDYGLDFFTKYRAAKVHASQKLGGGLKIPLWLALALFHREWYHEVDLLKDYKYKYLKKTF